MSASAAGDHRPVEVQREIGFTTRPVISGDRGVVAAGHYLAAQAGARMLDREGNAIDAGVAAGFVLSLVKPHHNGMGGEAPILVHPASAAREVSRVVEISGQGPAPRAATIDLFRRQGITSIPGDGFLPATVPAAFGAWCTALKLYGTMDLPAVLGPAIELAEDGFVVDPVLAADLARSAERFEAEWPSSVETFLPDGRPPIAGERLRQPVWAATFKRLADTAAAERRRGREAGIEAAEAAFYRGPIAEAIVEAQRAPILDATGRSHAGLLTMDDLAAHETRVGPALAYRYHGTEIVKCGPWTQGPVLFQQLAILAGYPLEEIGHDSAEYIHLVVEAAKLAFADRERYYGDPLFVDVPLDRLLSAEYAAARRALIDPLVAAAAVDPDDVPGGDWIDEGARWPLRAQDGDTTHLDVADEHGNLMSATPSGGWFQASPVIADVGFPLGTRAQQFNLEPGTPNALAPGKRPRTTLTPSIALRGGRPWMAFGTPGGDYQDQWSLQFLLNVVHFGMNLQEAIDAPTFHTDHIRSSFYPHAFEDRQIVVESRIDESVRDALAARGHRVVVAGPWANGQVTAVAVREDGGLEGAASPRTLVPYVVGR
jgi:gamma-glutamyltranspeptidase/glutathione hydrolase